VNAEARLKTRVQREIMRVARDSDQAKRVIRYWPEPATRKSETGHLIFIFRWPVIAMV
jgi:hypothetical protein